MSEEGEKDGVEKITPNSEGKIPADEAGKYPEVVPWSKYVGIKESLGNKLDATKQQVKDLEEKLEKAVSTEEHDKVKQELEDTKTKLQTTEEELKTVKEATVSELRTALVKKGVPEEKVKDLSEKELRSISEVLATVKPKPDMDGGGGGSEPPLSAKAKISRAFESLHPTS